MSEFSITASPTPCKVLDLKASYSQGCDKSGVARCLRKYFVFIRHSPQAYMSKQTVLLLMFHWLSWELVAQQPKRWRKVLQCRVIQHETNHWVGRTETLSVLRN